MFIVLWLDFSPEYEFSTVSVFHNLFLSQKLPKSFLPSLHHFPQPQHTNTLMVNTVEALKKQPHEFCHVSQVKVQKYY